MKQIDIMRLLTSIFTILLLCNQGKAQEEKADASFGTTCAQLLQAADDDAIGVAGTDGWFFLKRELQHVAAGAFWGDAARTVSQASRDDRKDPLPAIVAYSQALKDAGIELILLPVPAKSLVYPDKLSSSVELIDGKRPPRLDSTHQEFYRLLRNEEVEVLDIWPLLAELRGSADGPAYCKTDTHWSGMACVQVAQLLAAEIRQRSWYAAAQKTQLSVSMSSTAVLGDLVQRLPDEEKPDPEQIPIRCVGKSGDGPPTPITPDDHSPILLLADSHGLVFHAGKDMFAEGCGLADQLAYETSIIPSVIAVRGSGATPTRMSLYRKARRDPEFLNSKKLVIWVFTAREFTETSGWSVVPVNKQ